MIKSTVVPKKLVFVDKVVDVECGYDYTLALTLNKEKTTLWAWGCNDSG